MPELDISELENLAPTDEQLTTVSRIADQQLALELDIEQLTSELRTKKNLHVKVSQEDLPDAMLAMGMSSFTLRNGAAIDIKKGVDASIRVDDKPQAYEWLRENGHGAIIKNEFKVPFGAGQDEQAEQLDKFLHQINADFNAAISIHTQTLRAWARTQLEEGNPIPETIKVYEYSVAKVTPPRG
jgi:hypothetical protein